METYGNPILEDVQLDDNGKLKNTGKQNIKFYWKKFLDFKARPLLDEDGNQVYEINERTKKRVPLFDIDPQTGAPFKDAFENKRLMLRIETKGDTNIKDDFANKLDQHLHKRQYMFFMQGKVPTGHPIEDFEFIQPAVLMELKLLGIHVLEEVACMEDLECEQVTGQSGYELRDIAKQWVTINSPQGINQANTKLEKENAELRAQLELAKMGRVKGIKPVSLEQEVEATVEEPVKVLEMTHEEAKKGLKGRKRLVS